MDIEGEYRSNSEAVNDLIRKAREIEAVRGRLIEAEQSGFTPLTRDQIRAESGKRCGAMASYRISEKAKADLKQIYRRGVLEHGQAQPNRRPCPPSVNLDRFLARHRDA